MRTLYLFLLLIIISNTIAQSMTVKPVNPSIIDKINIPIIPTDPRICTALEKKPGYCFLIYKPVCGVYINKYGYQVKQTYSNRCVACKNVNVKYIYDGPCSKYPSNSQFCIPHPGISIFCIQLYSPVCGYYNKSVNCLVAPCAGTFTNSCNACLYNNVDYYVPGKCKPIIFYDLLKNAAVTKKP